jgi:hypothetical protein
MLSEYILFCSFSLERCVEISLYLSRVALQFDNDGGLHRPRLESIFADIVDAFQPKYGLFRNSRDQHKYIASQIQTSKKNHAKASEIPSIGVQNKLRK